ncbi:MAG: Flp family type IVb pilin [Actinomycetota bacterium]|nr:Flp family type IVb pilin [Actinomycetota bacterium]
MQLFNELFARLRALRTDENGQGMVEYALILVLVSIIAIVALTAIGTSVNTVFTTVGDALSAV